MQILHISPDFPLKLGTFFREEGSESSCIDNTDLARIEKKIDQHWWETPAALVFWVIRIESSWATCFQFSGTFCDTVIVQKSSWEPLTCVPRSHSNSTRVLPDHTQTQQSETRISLKLAELSVEFECDIRYIAQTTLLVAQQITLRKCGRTIAPRLTVRFGFRGATNSVVVVHA